MWQAIVASLLSIINRILGLREARSQDPDIRAVAKEQVTVETRDEHEQVVADAIATGNLDDLRKKAGE